MDNLNDNIVNTNLTNEEATSIISTEKPNVGITREELENLPGVGRKTVNLFLSELDIEPQFAVDTHVHRVSKRLNLADENDDVLETEMKLRESFKKEVWNRRNMQLVLFGRYHCKAVKPECDNCKLKDICRGVK